MKLSPQHRDIMGAGDSPGRAEIVEIAEVTLQDGLEVLADGDGHRPNLTEQVYEQLTDLLIRGELKPGDVITERRMAEQLNHILEAMEALKALDTSAIPPTAQVIPLQTVMREDAARPSWPVDEILRNAPRTDQQQFFVPPVFED